MPGPQNRSVPDFLYGTAWKEDSTAHLTELAIRMGFRAIDTANQRRHYFEAAVGQGLAAAYSAGLVTRADLFLQTKFTYQEGQDERLPYDPAASLSRQVAQSLASSLEHLGTDHVDSFLLHGPASRHGWTDEDAEVWEAMVRERDAGRTRMLGVSNVLLTHLEQMEEVHDELPAFVQNRCYARLGWDREIRLFCRERNVVYQGFSLLTANTHVLGHPAVTGLAQQANVTPAQIILLLPAQSACCRSPAPPAPITCHKTWPAVGSRWRLMRCVKLNLFSARAFFTSLLSSSGMEKALTHGVEQAFMPASRSTRWPASAAAVTGKIL